MVLEERITQAMKALGFTTNAARTYLALLRRNPATGYELAAASGVPRSAIYSVLKQLLTQGLVNAIQGKPARYVPLPPKQLYALLESRFARNLDELRTQLDKLAHQPEHIPTWTVQGYAQLLEQAGSLVENAHQAIYASLWAREARALEPQLRQARERGAKVILFSFNPLPEELGQQLSYGIPEEELEQHWSHRIILIVDDRHVLVGAAEDEPENRVVVSQEDAVIEMARANLVLDITLYGERTSTDTSEIVTALTRHLAPIEALVNGRSE